MLINALFNCTIIMIALTIIYYMIISMKNCSIHSLKEVIWYFNARAFSNSRDRDKSGYNQVLPKYNVHIASFVVFQCFQ